LGQASRAGVPGTDAVPGRPASFRVLFRHFGDRKRAPEPLRDRAEGIKQDNQKVLLVSNIKVDGKPIGAFGEGEFWFHIDGGYTSRPYRYTFLYALELPSTGGNTMFSNMYRACEAVPAGGRGTLNSRLVWVLTKPLKIRGILRWALL
jgi:taurine dioxygenase